MPREPPVPVTRLELSPKPNTQAAKELNNWLYIACDNGDQDMAQGVIWQGADVNWAMPNEATPLWIASYHGFTGHVELLLRKGADIDKAGKDNQTPLYVASLRGRPDVVSILLDKGADVNKTAEKNATALHIASAKSLPSSMEIMKMLMAKGTSVNKANKDGATPLHFAAKAANVQAIELLLESGAVIKENNDGATPLDLARKESHTSIVQLLSAKKNMQMNEALRSACRAGDVHLVKSLLNAGAIVSAADEVGTPLYHACLCGHEEVAELLLERGARYNKLNPQGRSPLFAASQAGDIEIIEMLLERGAVVNRVDNAGDTPIIIAAENGHLPAVQLLYEKGASLSHSMGGRTALEAAIQNDRKPVTAFLQKKTEARAKRAQAKNSPGNSPRSPQAAEQPVNAAASERPKAVPVLKKVSSAQYDNPPTPKEDRVLSRLNSVPAKSSLPANLSQLDIKLHKRELKKPVPDPVQSTVTPSQSMASRALHEEDGAAALEIKKLRDEVARLSSAQKEQPQSPRPSEPMSKTTSEEDGALLAQEQAVNAAAPEKLQVGRELNKLPSTPPYNSPKSSYNNLNSLSRMDSAPVQRHQSSSSTPSQGGSTALLETNEEGKAEATYLAGHKKTQPLSNKISEDSVQDSAPPAQEQAERPPAPGTPNIVGRGLNKLPSTPPNRSPYSSMSDMSGLSRMDSAPVQRHPSRSTTPQPLTISGSEDGSYDDDDFEPSAEEQAVNTAAPGTPRDLEKALSIPPERSPQSSLSGNRSLKRLDSAPVQQCVSSSSSPFEPMSKTSSEEDSALPAQEQAVNTAAPETPRAGRMLDKQPSAPSLDSPTQAKLGLTRLHSVPVQRSLPTTSQSMTSTAESVGGIDTITEEQEETADSPEKQQSSTVSPEPSGEISHDNDDEEPAAATPAAEEPAAAAAEVTTPTPATEEAAPVAEEAAPVADAPAADAVAPTEQQEETVNVTAPAEQPQEAVNTAAPLKQQSMTRKEPEEPPLEGSIDDSDSIAEEEELTAASARKGGP